MNRFLMMAAMLAVTACSSGSGNDPDEPTPPAPAPVTGDVQSMLNNLREQNGRTSVHESRLLRNAALTHARDMAANNFFDHEGSNGSQVGDRARAAGYGWCLIAEYIAQGQQDREAAMEAWTRSRGHRANMLIPDITEFGFAQAEDYWVMVLGRPGC
ncbi:CAP domain-containing protein [Roseivivax sp. CAU 1761]